MSKATTPGTQVLTPHGTGTAIDVRATPSGVWVIGVEEADGQVHYFVDRAVRPAQP